MNIRAILAAAVLSTAGVGVAAQAVAAPQAPVVARTEVAKTSTAPAKTPVSKTPVSKSTVTKVKTGGKMHRVTKVRHVSKTSKARMHKASTHRKAVRVSRTPKKA